LANTITVLRFLPCQPEIKILFAADSARILGGQTTYDACKITRVDTKTVFTVAGIAGWPGVSFSDKAAELLREKPIHTQRDLASTAIIWTDWVIAQLNDSIKNFTGLPAAVNLSPIEAIFATVDDKRKVVFVRSTFEIVNVLISSDPRQIQAGWQIARSYMGFPPRKKVRLHLDCASVGRASTNCVSRKLNGPERMETFSQRLINREL
jgi:hypothetical protein